MKNPESAESGRTYLVTVLCLACLLVGCVIGWVLKGQRNEAMTDRIVAVSWGDGEYGEAFYGAYVYLVPESGDYSVRARIYIGRGNDYWHECGEIGRAETDVEAVEKWGTITWTDDGLNIGDPASGGYHMLRTKLESHR